MFWGRGAGAGVERKSARKERTSISCVEKGEESTESVFCMGVEFEIFAKKAYVWNMLIKFLKRTIIVYKLRHF